MSDEIRLTLPAGRGHHHVAQLVVGGLAVRLNLTYENLEDLQIAVESLLQRARRGDEVTVELTVGERSITAAVGPVEGEAVRAELEGDAGGQVGLRRVLDTVADGYELVQREGGDWLSIKKRVDTRDEPDTQ